MLEKLLQPEIQDFIFEHQNDNPTDLMLQSSKYPNWPMREITAQIQARQKAKNKLPSEFLQKNILLKPLSVEQCSSQETASYKSKLIAGKTLLDLTGGLGIDTFFFAQVFEKVIYNEIQEELFEMVRHNYRSFGIENVFFFQKSAVDLLKETDWADVIYLDPARRDEQARKVFQLRDCSPNVLEMMPLLLQKSTQILLKLSPMLDIDQGIQAFHQKNVQVQKVWVLALHNEVKELLFLICTEKIKEPEIIAVNLEKNQTNDFPYKPSEEENAEIPYRLPETDDLLIEPNRAILKAGAFKIFADRYDLYKLHPNSHLYLTNLENFAKQLKSDFSGMLQASRVFKIQAVSKYHKKEIQAYLPQKKANITARNFPESVAHIRRKLELKEGGSKYLFATTTLERNLVILVCEPISNPPNPNIN